MPRDLSTPEGRAAAREYTKQWRLKTAYVRPPLTAEQQVDANVRQRRWYNNHGDDARRWNAQKQGRLCAKRPVAYSLRWYKNNCQRSGKVWDLTDDEHRTLVLAPCVYCNKEATEERKKLNGIDRADNTLRRYVRWNCVSCCWDCNQTKGARYSPEEFRSPCDRVAAGIKHPPHGNGLSRQQWRDTCERVARHTAVTAMKEMGLPFV